MRSFSSMFHLKRMRPVNALAVKRAWRVVFVVVLGLTAAGVSYAASSVLSGPGGRPVEPIELDRPSLDVDTSVPGSEATVPRAPVPGGPPTAPPTSQVPDGDDTDDTDTTDDTDSTDDTDTTDTTDDTDTTDTTDDD